MEVIKSILQKNGITQPYENGKKMDKENRLFITDDYVIKIYYPKKFPYYYNELEVYKGLSDNKGIPKLYYCGDESDYKYIIISRIYGKSLFDEWINYTHEEKQRIVKQMVEIIKSINNIKTKEVNFQSYLDDKYLKAISGLNFSECFLRRIDDLYNDLRQHIGLKEIANLIHVDIHFYNFLVNDDKLFAYDFENTVMAPLDYQLLRLYRMGKYPETFVYPKGSLNDKERDSFKDLLPIFLSYYPELASSQCFEGRLKLYLLVYLLEEAKRCKLTEETVANYIKENEHIRVREK